MENSNRADHHIIFEHGDSYEGARTGKPGWWARDIFSSIVDDVNYLLRADDTFEMTAKFWSEWPAPSFK